MTNTEYVEHFKALVGVIKTYGGEYGQEPGLVVAELIAQGMKPEDVDTADCTAIITAKEVCRDATSHASCSAEPATADTSSARWICQTT